ncbi:unnamed protein product [Toxocara canis]|uniref:Beta-lactamase domain-containing protein n=1 Tax=Toxocara canis TaxID=6265 RepID=A0A183V410_TOXCA|nr:unnamed protein product [Toxocara canis]
MLIWIVKLSIIGKVGECPVARLIDVSEYQANLRRSFEKWVYSSGELLLMGSTASQCGSLSSDLDLCLAINRGKFGYDPYRNYELDVLTTLASLFQSNEISTNFFQNVQVIPAKVPILKCRVSSTFGDVDIDINCNNLAGVYNSHLLHYYARYSDLSEIQKFEMKKAFAFVALNKFQFSAGATPFGRVLAGSAVRSEFSTSNVLTVGVSNKKPLPSILCKSIDSRFPALCVVVKQWAEAASINDPMNGTLNSYAIKLMVLHFLQCGVWPPVLPNLCKLDPFRFGGVKYCIGLSELRLFDTVPQLPSDRKLNDKTISELLMAFFDYYARFDFDKYEISIRDACIIQKIAKEYNNDRTEKMMIRGPVDSVNVARTVKTDASLELIVDAFKRAAHIYLGPVPKAPLFNEIVHARLIECCNYFKVCSGAPGLSIGVSVNGRRVWADGFGLADVEQAVPCSAETVMRIASISKTITAAIAARLVQDGKLDLDANVQKYLPDYPKKEFEGKPVDITVRQLLCHTSGIRHYRKVSMFGCFYCSYRPNNQ